MVAKTTEPILFKYAHNLYCRPINAHKVVLKNVLNQLLLCLKTIFSMLVFVVTRLWFSSGSMVSKSGFDIFIVIEIGSGAAAVAFEKKGVFRSPFLSNTAKPQPLKQF